jgi:HAMP domain-containing protein
MRLLILIVLLVGIAFPAFATEPSPPPIDEITTLKQQIAEKDTQILQLQKGLLELSIDRQIKQLNEVTTELKQRKDSVKPNGKDVNPQAVP